MEDLHKKLSMTVVSKGLNLVPKLKLEHDKLTSYSQMHVDLAAQVFIIRNSCVIESLWCRF